MRCLEDFQQFDFKHRVLNGGMDAPAPRSPYASSCGIVSSHLEPTGIRVSASIQPGITPLTGNSAGSPRATELSNTVPSISLPV